jgi:hypothetical protein
MSDYEPNTHSADNSEMLVKNTITAKSKPKVPFWSENPNIILNTNYLLEFFPTDTMSYAQKLNAISRLVLALAIIGFILTRSMRLVLVTCITLFGIYLINSHYVKSINTDKDLEGFGLWEESEITLTPTKTPEAKRRSLEGLKNPALDMLNDMNIEISPDVFDKSTPENPFSNVLINDYDYNPNKKPAPPIAKPEISDNILADAKTMVQKLNPRQPNIADKLFRDLGEQFVFEQSMRPFYSTASTTIPNDQAGFADFCYGSMISCKEGNLFACARNNSSKYINQ